MKQRRTIIISFLLAVVMLLGVGYAATATDVLEITGAINVAQSAVEGELDPDVYFVSAELERGADKTTEGLNASCSVQSVEKPDVAYMTVDAFTEINQKAVYTYTIANASTEKDVSVTLNINEGAAEDYVTFTTDWDTTTKDIAKSADESNPNTITVTVTAVLTKVPSDVASFRDFAITLTASYK